MATLIGLVPPFIGALVYLLLRPPEYLEEVRERELEIRAMEDRLADRNLPGSGGRAQAESRFLVCPVGTTKRKQACAKCKAPPEGLWQGWPFFWTPVRTGPP